MGSTSGLGPAIALSLVPLAAGLVSRAYPLRVRWLVCYGVFVCLLLFAWWMWPTADLWDALAFCGLWMLSATLPARGAAGLLLALGLAEGLLRVPGLPVGRLPMTGPPSLWLPRRDARWSDLCVFSAKLRDRPHRVLHLGDSIAAGHGLAPSTPRFTDLLADASPTTDEVNAAIPATSVDCHLLVLRSMPEVGLDRVFVWLYPNDLSELHIVPDSVPPEATILQVLPGAPVPPQLPEPETPLAVAARMPPPYVLRIGAEHSALASALAYRWYALGEGVASWLGGRIGRQRDAADVIPATAEVLNAIDAEARRRGAAVTLVVMPMRAELDAPADLRSTELLRAAQATGLEVIDAWAPFSEWQAELGAALYVGDLPGEIHLSAEGHRRWAAWLSGVPGAVAPE